MEFHTGNHESTTFAHETLSKRQRKFIAGANYANGTELIGNTLMNRLIGQKPTVQMLLAEDALEGWLPHFWASATVSWGLRHRFR